MENRKKEQKMLRSFNSSTSTQVAFSSLNSKQDSMKAIMTGKNMHELMRQFGYGQDLR